MTRAKAARLVPILFLAACGHVTPAAPPATLAIATSCVPKGTPAAPPVHSPEQQAQAPSGPDYLTMTAADYHDLYAWMLQASPVLERCRQAGVQPNP